MITVLSSEEIIPIIESSVKRNIDYTDTFEFSVPIGFNINLEDEIRVTSPGVNQDYRVCEVTSDGFTKKIFGKSVFFDSAHMLLNLPKEDFVGVSLSRLLMRLNNHLRNKQGGFRIIDKTTKSNVVANLEEEVGETSLYDFLLGEKGLCETYKVKLTFDNRVITLHDDIVGKNTEILFHSNKNIASLDYNLNKKDIVTRLYVTCKYKMSEEEKKRRKEEEKKRKDAEKEAAKAASNKKKSNEDIAYEVVLGRWGNGAARIKKLKDAGYDPKVIQPIVNDIVWKKRKPKSTASSTSTSTTAATSTTNVSPELEAEFDANPAEEEEIIFKTVYESPNINAWNLVYEATYSFESEEIDSQEKLEEWCRNNLFTEEDGRDVPSNTFTFEPVKEYYKIDLYDKAKVHYDVLGIYKVIKCVEYEYDPHNDKYIKIDFGNLKTNPRAEAINNVKEYAKESDEKIAKKTDAKLKIHNLLIGGYNKEFEEQLLRDREAFDFQFSLAQDEHDERMREGFEQANRDAIEFQNNIRLELENSINAAKEDINSQVDKNTKAIEELDDSVGKALLDVNDAKNKLDEIVIPDVESIVTNKITEERKITETTINDKIENLSITDKVNEIISDENGIIVNISRTAAEAKSEALTAKTTAEGYETRIDTIEGKFNPQTGKLAEFETFESKYKRTAKSTEDFLNALKTNFNDNGTVKEISNITSVAKSEAEKKFNELKDIKEKFNDRGELKEFTSFKNTYEETARNTSQTLENVKRYINTDGSIKDTLNTHITNKSAEVFEREISKAERGIITKANIREEATGVMREYIKKVDNLKLGTRNYVLDSDVTTTTTRKDFKLSDELLNNLNSIRGKQIIVSAEIDNNNASGDDGRNGFEMKITYQDNTTYWPQIWNHESTFKGRKHAIFKIPDKPIKSIEAYTRNQWRTGKFTVGRPMLEVASIPSDYQPAHEDMVNSLATYKDGVDRKLSELTTSTNDNKTAISKVVQTAKEISNQITFDNNGNVKFREVKLDAAGNKISHTDKTLNGTSIANIIQQDSNGTRILTEKVLENGSKVASSIVNSGEAINIISDNVRVTANSENLLRTEAERNFTISNFRDKYAATFYKNEGADKLKAGDEFLISGDIIGNNPHASYVGITADTNAGTKWWYTTLVGANQTGKKTATLKLPPEVDNLTISRYRVFTNINANSNHGSRTFKDLSVIKKKDASFIVNGTIEGQHIKTNTIGAGHLTAGAVTADKIAAKAIRGNHIEGDSITASHIKVDEALINKLNVKTVVAEQVEAIDVNANLITVGRLHAKQDARLGDYPMTIDMTTGHTRYAANASIQFDNRYNFLYRVRNKAASYLFFNDDGFDGTYTVLGVDSNAKNDRGNYTIDDVSATFAGIRLVSADGTSNFDGEYYKFREISLVSDRVDFVDHGTSGGEYATIRNDGKGRIDLVETVRELARLRGIKTQWN